MSNYQSKKPKRGLIGHDHVPSAPSEEPVKNTSLSNPRTPKVYMNVLESKPSVEQRKLVIAMPYYKNGGMLRAQQAEWAKYPEEIRKNMTVIIADDGSPENKAIENVVDCDYDLQIYQIDQNIPWNQNGARNLAMFNAPDEWVLMTDIDHILEAEQAVQLVDMPVKRSAFYVPTRKLANGTSYKNHPNSYYMLKALYWEAGGADEDFAGVYGSDAMFRRIIESIGERVEVQIPLTLYGRQVIADASTTDWGRKDSEFHVSHNYVLSQKKKSQVLEKAKNPLRFTWKRVK